MKGGNDKQIRIKFVGYNSFRSTLQHGEAFPRYGVKLRAEIAREELNPVPFPVKKDTEGVGVCTPNPPAGPVGSPCTKWFYLGRSRGCWLGTCWGCRLGPRWDIPSGNLQREKERNSSRF